MSKFQVGDKVVVDGRELEVVLADDDISKNVWCGLNGKGWVLVPADELERSAPYVPDVDGNPIRVGQLVESIRPKADSRYWTIAPAWVDEVSADSQEAMVNGHWVSSESLRVVTDTFRPPEPDT